MNRRTKSPVTISFLRRRVALLSCGTFCVFVAGCGGGDQPPLGRVTGVVTVDGEPAPRVAVLFSQPGYRSSSGLTNEAGEYELSYIKEVKGAVVGEHKVRLDFLPQEQTGRRRLPEKYNRKTVLTAVVENGANKIDFPVQSR